MTRDRHPSVAGRFAAVDASPAPHTCVHYLDRATSVPSIRRHKRRTFGMLALRPGAHVLEIGCGLGDDARTLASMVGRTGRVLGVDISETMIAQANARCGREHANVRFLVADVERLRLPARSFDAVRADRVLQHVDDPLRALREMGRVTRPGGHVVVSEPDWDTLLVDGGDTATERILRAFCSDSTRHGTIGRRLPRLMADSGLRVTARAADVLRFTELEEGEAVLGVADAALRAARAGVITDQIAAQWIDTLRSLQARGLFLCAVTGIAVRGVPHE